MGLKNGLVTIVLIIQTWGTEFGPPAPKYKARNNLMFLLPQH